MVEKPSRRGSSGLEEIHTVPGTAWRVWKLSKYSVFLCITSTLPLCSKLWRNAGECISTQFFCHTMMTFKRVFLLVDWSSQIPTTGCWAGLKLCGSKSNPAWVFVSVAGVLFSSFKDNKSFQSFIFNLKMIHRCFKNLYSFIVAADSNNKVGLWPPNSLFSSQNTSAFGLVL